MIKIDKEFEALIPPLSSDEFQQLEANIMKDGIRDPLVVWPQDDGTDILIDGHNRWKISAKHAGIRFSIKRMQFIDRDEAIAWIADNQLGRRNLHVLDREALMNIKREAIARRAKANQIRKNADSVMEIFPEQKGQTTRDIIGKELGVSGRQVDKLHTINEKASEETKQKVRNGEISVNQAYLDIKGFTDKSPKQLHKEFIDRVEKKREDYKEQKKNGIVSIKDANADKENAKILANELYSRCMKMGDAIGSVYLDHKEGTINLKELATTLSPEDLRSLREALGEDRKRLLIIIAEVLDEKCIESC